MADEMAKADGIDLSDDHWEIINFLREYYEEYQIAPAVRVLTKAVGKKLGKDKGNSKYLYELFPYGPCKQACKFAGLPKPRHRKVRSFAVDFCEFKEVPYENNVCQ